MLVRLYIAFIAVLTCSAVYVAGTRGLCSVESLINTVLYSLLSLLAVIVLQREQHFRGIFYQMWFLFTGFSLVVSSRIFAALLPSPYLQSDVYVYSTMILPLLVSWTVVYVLYAYIFVDWPRLHRILLTIATVFPLWLIAFHPYYLSPQALAQQAVNPLLYYQPLYERAVYMNFLSLSAVVTFFIIKFRSDRAFGVYIDTLMFWFSLFVIFEILYNFCRVTHLSIFTISQYAATGTLLMIVVTFILRLHFLSRTAGAFYESQIVRTDPFVGRRAGFFDRIIRGHFFNSKEIAKRLYLESPQGKISSRASKRRLGQSHSFKTNAT